MTVCHCGKIGDRNFHAEKSAHILTVRVATAALRFLLNRIDDELVQCIVFFATEKPRVGPVRTIDKFADGKSFVRVARVRAERHCAISAQYEERSCLL